MEENEIPWELNSFSLFVCIETMDSLKPFSHLSSLPSDPLFSCIITLYILILLYFPHVFLRIVFSPVLIITGALLLCLLRLAAIQRFETESKGNRESNESEKDQETKSAEVETSSFLLQEREWVPCKNETEPEPETRYDLNPEFEERFVEWNVRAPLEVIYEGHEGEEEEHPDSNHPNPYEKAPTRLERYPSLSLYYPESDSDSSSDSELPMIGDWVSPDGICFRWEEEDRDGLIEITLDHGDNHDDNHKDIDFHGEEENLIEIDISPTANH